MVMVLDSAGHGFEFQSFHIWATTLGKLFVHAFLPASM